MPKERHIDRERETSSLHRSFRLHKLDSYNCLVPARMDTLYTDLPIIIIVTQSLCVSRRRAGGEGTRGREEKKDSLYGIESKESLLGIVNL